MTIATTSPRGGANKSRASVAPSDCTVLVNSAFLQEIKDSNPDLWHAMHQLRQTCDSEERSAGLLRKMVRLLDDLRDRWAMQFALEESYGYLRVPSEPNYACSTDDTDLRCKSDHAASAMSQHCSLYLRLSDLAEHAEELQYRGGTAEQLNSLIEASRSFDQAIRRHERQEQELIESTYRVPPPR